MRTTKFTAKELKSLNEETTTCNVTTKIEFLNGNFSQCFKQIIEQMKNKLDKFNVSGSTELNRQFDELTTSVSNVNFETSSFDTINDFLLSLLKTTQDMALLVDSIPVLFYISFILFKSRSL